MVFHNKCCIPSCTSETTIRHCFPNPDKDMDKFKKWLQAINNSELMEMDPKNVFKNKRLCHEHFQSKDISAWSHRLFPNAVPTLNLSSSSLAVTQNYETSSSSSQSLQEISSRYKESSDSSTSTNTAVSEHENTIPTTPYQLLKQAGITKVPITPRKQLMYKAMKKLRKQYTMERNRNRSVKRRLFEANKFEKKYCLENIAKLNSLASMLIQLQFRESEKSKKLRRFTIDEKLLALILFKQSPKSYSLLSKIFILPSKSTLSRLLSEIVGGPGINENMFESVAELTSEMDPSEKYVAILLDEMAIMPSLHFNEPLGSIDGFQDMGDDIRACSIASHVLVFMIRGLKKQWKAPISYHFSSNAGATMVQIKTLLIIIVKKLLNIGLKPITVICDQYNSSVINNLIQETREAYMRAGNISSYRDGSFEVENFLIYPMFDPPHLLKGLRNNLVKKDLSYTKDKMTRTAKWSHILYIYERDNEAGDGLRVLPHLTDEHIYENKLRKMKVKHAAQIFSTRLAASLSLISRVGQGLKPIGETADLLLFFDRLFDSVNSSSKLPEGGKNLRAGLSDESDHLKFWNTEALPLLESMEFQKIAPRDQARPPSLNNWSFTIRNIKAIWNVLKNAGFSYLLTRRLNQDPLENAFGQLRSFGAQNTNPSANQFAGSFKILLFNNALSMYKDSFNCEDDECDYMFLSLKKLFSKKDDGNTPNLQGLKLDHLNEQTSSQFNELHEFATSYVAGFILKKLKKSVSCCNCRECLFSTDYDARQNLLISFREYGGIFARRLCYPTPQFLDSFHKIFQIINFLLDKNPFSKTLVQEIEETIKINLSFQFITCCEEDHKRNIIALISKFTIRTIVHNWCKQINQIIQGRSKLYEGSNKTKLAANRIRLNRIKKKDSKNPRHIIRGSI